MSPRNRFPCSSVHPLAVAALPSREALFHAATSFSTPLFKLKAPASNAQPDIRSPRRPIFAIDVHRAQSSALGANLRHRAISP
jgi:hypothetical protein